MSGSQLVDGQYSPGRGVFLNMASLGRCCGLVRQKEATFVILLLQLWLSG